MILVHFLRRPVSSRVVSIARPQVIQCVEEFETGPAVLFGKRRGRGQGGGRHVLVDFLEEDRLRFHHLPVDGSHFSFWTTTGPNSGAELETEPKQHGQP